MPIEPPSATMNLGPGKAHEPHETLNRSTRLEVDFDRLAHNLSKLRERCEVPVMGMVKARGYGAGVELAVQLDRLNIDALGVAYPIEGFELRSAGVTCPILVMSAEKASYPQMIEAGLEPSIFRLDQISDWAEAAKNAGKTGKKKVQLKVETGMHRMGLSSEHWGDAGRLCRKLNVPIGSVFSHLAAADLPEKDPFTRAQIKVYRKACIAIAGTAGASNNGFQRHLANTAASARFPEARFDMVRIGLGLHGFDLSGSFQGLKPVSRFLTEISQLNHVPAGEAVGYNAGQNSTADHDRIIAILPVGYADGYPRNLGNATGEVAIRNENRASTSDAARSWRCPTVGPVCMDFTMIDVTGVKVQVGSEVELFGDAVGLEEMAYKAGTLPYEIICGVQQRVQRRYL